MELFEIEVETWNEEIKIIETTTFLEDAVAIAKNIPIESYKAISINQVSLDGKLEIVFDEEGNILMDRR